MLWTTVCTNTAMPSVNVADLCRLVEEAERRRALLKTDFVFTADAWAMVKAGLPVWEDPGLLLDHLHGIPAYVYATEAEAAAKVRELELAGRRPELFTADTLRGVDVPVAGHG